MNNIYNALYEIPALYFYNVNKIIKLEHHNLEKVNQDLEIFLIILDNNLPNNRNVRRGLIFFSFTTEVKDVFHTYDIKKINSEFKRLGFDITLEKLLDYNGISIKTLDFV